MSGQLHITHRGAYLRGRRDGGQDARTDSDYRPRDGAGGTDDQHAYGLGYEDGWTEGHPCSNGTCDHLAHANR